MSDLTKQSELKNCPFCGSAPRVTTTGVWWVVCDECACEGPVADSEAEAIAIWNTRPASAGVREALGESSQTLEYLRREARTWGKIFSVNVDHVLDKNRKALSALTRPLGGFVQGSIARKQSTDTEGSSRTETAGGAG